MRARRLMMAAVVGLGLLAGCTNAPPVQPVQPSTASPEAGPTPEPAPPGGAFQLPPNPMIGGVPMYPSRDLADNLAQSPDHRTLVAALQAAGLTAALKQPGPFTVFAPIDAAFHMLPPGQPDQLMEPANRARLAALLDGHIVRGRFDSSTLGQQVAAGNGATELATLADTKLTARLNGAVNLVLRDPAGGFANIAVYDVVSANGVIHVIDKVLLPAQTR